MPDNISKYNEQRRAELALAHAEDMAQRALQAVEEAKRAVEATKLPKSPGDGQYRIELQFERGGTIYTFLVLIKNGKVYTTAIKDGGMFPSWAAFAEWVRSNDAHWSGGLYRLQSAGKLIGINL